MALAHELELVLRLAAPADQSSRHGEAVAASAAKQPGVGVVELFLFGVAAPQKTLEKSS